MVRIRTVAELELSNEEFDDVTEQVVQAMGREIQAIGKFDLATYSREEFRQVAAAAFGVSAAAIFGKRISVIPPFDLERAAIAAE